MAGLPTSIAMPLPPPPNLAHTRLPVLVVQVASVNLLIAALLALVGGGRFGNTLVYSECVGLSIFSIVEIGRRGLRAGPSGWPAGWRGVALIASACTLGYAIGVTLADALLGNTTWRGYTHRPDGLLRDFGPTVIFCIIVSGWYWFRGQERANRARLAEARHAATLARLDLLQSQLEPHMLFNTLANLRALIGADPERAQEMLDHLIAFLRATLAASRQSEHPLADEFARLDDYLALMRVRMGERLRATTRLPAELAALRVPPLLLQPLVENAIKHGLEPQRGTGELLVDARRDGATLVLQVRDSGRGLEAAAAARVREPGDPGSGFGLAQVRERLHALHGDAATFTLAPRPEGGTLAEIRLPLNPA